MCIFNWFQLEIDLRILHDNGFSDDEYKQQTAVIHSNATQSMGAIIKAMGTLDIKYGDPEREVDKDKELR